MLSTPERPTLRQARTWQQREQDQPTLLSPARCSQTCLKSKKFIWNLEQLNISCLFFSWDFQSQQRRCLSRSSTDSRSYQRDKSYDWVKVILKLKHFSLQRPELQPLTVGFPLLCHRHALLIRTLASWKSFFNIVPQSYIGSSCQAFLICPCFCLEFN